MTITTNDIRLQQSEVISDEPEGGGRASPNEVVDGELNNLFDDISRLDRVYGRVSLRKAFLRVETADTSKYLGAHAIITDPPLDGQVAVVMFQTPASTRDWDRRDASQARVEHYLTQAQVSTLTLWDTQPAEATNLVAYQEATLAVPEISEVLCLSVEATGHADYGYQQFVRIVGMTSEIVPYSTLVSGGTGGKSCRLMTIQISDPLEIAFPGGDIVEFPDTSDKPTRVRKTTLGDGSDYYGVVPLAADIALDETDLQVTTILQPIVPATYSETSLLDQQLGGENSAQVAAGPEMTLTFSKTASSGSFSVQLPIVPLPGSITLVADASSDANDFTLEDAAGVLNRVVGGASTTAVTGTAAYSAGLLTVLSAPNVSYTVSVTFVPAVSIPGVQFTHGILIEEATRGFNYNATVSPLPTPGSFVAQYRALGVWYTLIDTGNGTLTGDAGTGSGTINYLTGTVNITTGYETEVGSHVLFGWGSGTSYDIQVDPADITAATVNGGFILAAGLVEGSITVEWPAASPTYSATDDGNGNFTGAASGTVEYTEGRVRLIPDVLPAAGTVIHFAFEARSEVITETPTPSVGGDVTFTLAQPPVAPNSVKIRAIYADENSESHEVVYQQTGLNFTIAGATNGSGVQFAAEIGSISNTTGNVSIPNVINNGYVRYYTSYAGGGSYMTTDASDLTFASILEVTYQEDTAGTGDGTDITLTSLGLDYSTTLSDGLVPGSMLVSINGRTYYDRNNGLYYRNSSDAEFAAGSIDYTSGLGLITSWATGTLDVDYLAALTVLGTWEVQDIVWRTSGAPLRSQSFQVTNGVETAIDDGSETLDGSTQITGTINNQTGVYDVTFAPPVAPTSARYNAVAITYLPLDPELLGLNPVRLPLDGQVPVIAPGRTLVIHDTQTVELTNPVVAGTPYGVGRTRVSYLLVRDADGVAVDTTKYSQDLIAGELTFLAPLDLSAYTQPLTVEHRAEDMVLCTGAELSGQLTFTGRITHDFTAANSYVSSALLFGDLQAAVHTVQTQETWLDDWDNYGEPTDANYNNVTYPITSTNDGAITERWRLEFTSAIAFEVVGETTGIVAVGQTDADCEPINPSSGAPYFTLLWQGWGAGWNPGNNLRFSTRGAEAPIWFLRCTLQGPLEDPVDRVRVQLRGDSN